MLTVTKVPRRRLRKIMADRGLTSRQVADLLGIKRQTVLCYMSGVRELPKHRLDRLERTLAGGAA